MGFGIYQDSRPSKYRFMYGLDSVAKDLGSFQIVIG